MRKILFGFVEMFKRIYYNSSLHLFYYKAQIPNDYSLVWIALSLGSVGLAVWSIYSSILSFMDNRPIITIITQNFPYEFVIFPCLSICTYNKVSRTEFQPIDNILVENNISREDIDDFASSLQYLVSLETFNYGNKVIKNHSDIFQLLRNYNYTVDALMYQVRPRCDTILRSCRFQSTNFKCSNLMNTVKTVEGWCCSFNYRGTIEFGDEFVSFDAVEEIEPIKTGSERGNGLDFHINLDPDDFLSPILPSYTAKILVSDPVDFAEAHLRSSVIGIGQVLRLEIKAFVIETSPNLRTLPIDVRHCIYPEETPAGELYRYHTCVAKCKADFIYDHCGCVPFNFPATRNESRRVCELSDLNCVKTSKREIETVIPNSTVKAYCGCLPECEDTFYRVLSKREYWNETIEHRLVRDHPEFYNDSYLSVYYRSNTCTKYRSEAFMVWNEFLAAIGGTLGLCVGGSVLGIIEVFYYMCVRSKVTKEINPTLVRPAPIFPFTH